MRATGIRRYEGRLFVEDGRLCMVVEANEETGIGRVSCRIDGQQAVFDMALADIGRRLSLGSELTLDSVGGSESTKRIVRKKDGWFFSAREGLKGPYGSDEEAERELNQYILAAQSA